MRSVLAQTFGDWELLILDDGSADGSREIVEGFRDPRIRYLPRPHRGIAPSRNEAMARSSAPLLAFLDSDDVWDPRKLERQHAFFHGASSEVGVLYTGSRHVDDDGRIHRVVIPPPTGRGRIFDRLLYTHGIVFSSVMVRREAIDVIGGFNEALISGSDREWLLRMARRFAFDFLPEALVEYRLHRGSSMMGDLRARLVLTETILTQYAEELRRRPRLLAHKYLSLARLHLRLGETQAARQAMREAIAASPGFLPAYLHLASSYGGWAAWMRLSRARRDLGDWWGRRGQRQGRA
jgi:glycosyltransferase involved in cell wall biosynthesis